MNHGQSKNGFSLIELLVVMGVIGLLMSVLIPSLRSARQAAYQILCCANIAAIGDGFIAYSQNNRDYFPAAYTYVESGSPTPLISHWSSVLQDDEFVSEKHTLCPIFRRKGLPPQSTTDDNLEQGQVSAVNGQADRQVSRCAYTVNEALCPRNRFEVGFEGTVRPSRYVRISEVAMAGNTILLTEWTTDWTMLSLTGTEICRSYLPVHGVKALGTGSHYELNTVPITPNKPCFSGGIYEKLTGSDLSRWQSPLRTSPSRLDWVGRNHGLRKNSARTDMRKSCFAYVDGHVECKSIFETLSPDFEWGDRIYSINSLYGDINIK